MRFIDRYGEDILEVVWAKANAGRWVTSQIPTGQKIVGIVANTKGQKNYIPRLAFLLREEEELY